MGWGQKISKKCHNGRQKNQERHKMGSLIIANFNSCNRPPYTIRDVIIYKDPNRQGQGKPLPFSWNLFIWQCLLCFLVRPLHLRHRCTFPFENEKAPLPFFSYVVAPANENTLSYSFLRPNFFVVALFTNQRLLIKKSALFSKS